MVLAEAPKGPMFGAKATLAHTWEEICESW